MHNITDKFVMTRKPAENLSFHTCYYLLSLCYFTLGVRYYKYRFMYSYCSYYCYCAVPTDGSVNQHLLGHFPSRLEQSP